MKNFLLVGCGNIGKRHLESLLDLKIPAKITIVEPNDISQNNAKSLISEIDFHEKEINWLLNLSDITDSYDCAIVATLSNNRPELIRKILEKGTTKFLLEKMVCQSDLEYKEILNDLKQYNAKGWVNTNLRYFSFYKSLKQSFKNEEPIKFIISAGDKGLGSNAIHYLDLFSWYAETNKIVLNGDLLSEKILPNKRDSKLVEFSGTINGQSNNSEITISFSPESTFPVIVEIFNSKNHILINMDNSSITKICGLEDFSENFRFQHASELTKNIVMDIISNDNCDLPSLEDLFPYHSELLRIFNQHLLKTMKIEPKLCPIT